MAEPSTRAKWRALRSARVSTSKKCLTGDDIREAIYRQLSKWRCYDSWHSFGFSKGGRCTLFANRRTAPRMTVIPSWAAESDVDRFGRIGSRCASLAILDRALDGRFGGLAQTSGAPHFGLIRALEHPGTATRRNLQGRKGPDVGVNKWLFAASISCVSKQLRQ